MMQAQCARSELIGLYILVTDLTNNGNSSNPMFSLQLHFGLFVPSLHLSVCQNELKCTDGCKLRCTDLVSNSLKHNLHFKWFGSSFSLQFHRCSNLIGARATVLCFIKSVLQTSGCEVCLASTSESGCKNSDRNLDSRQTMCVPKSENFLTFVQVYCCKRSPPGFHNL